MSLRFIVPALTLPELAGRCGAYVGAGWRIAGTQRIARVVMTGGSSTNRAGGEVRGISCR